MYCTRRSIPAWSPADKKLSKRLDGRNHAGHDILSMQHAPDFGLDAIPSAGGKFAQQLAIETCVNSQTLGDGKDHLSVRNGKTNIFGDVDACHKRALLVAGWAGASLLAGEGNEHFMLKPLGLQSLRRGVFLLRAVIQRGKLVNNDMPCSTDDGAEESKLLSVIAPCDKIGV